MFFEYFKVEEKKLCTVWCRVFLEAPPGFEPGIRVLQTRALPLGHGAILNYNADAMMIRTRINLERITGLEPATFALARRRSTK